MAEIVKNEPTAQTIKPVKPLSLPPEERSSLIHEMMQSFCDDLEYSITKEHTDPATALENLRSMDATVRFGELTQTPLRDVSWRHLRALEMDDPKLMEQYWIEMKNVARDQIRSGHFAARGAGVANQHPWERATFLALREELSEEWKPRDSIEQTLIDQMAQAYYQYILWSERAALWGVLQPKRKDLREQSARLPQLTEAQAMEQDSNMAERYHRMFLRCQRALRDSRRYSVNIQGAKQVNIGDQQINVTQETDEKQ